MSTPKAKRDDRHAQLHEAIDALLDKHGIPACSLVVVQTTDKDNHATSKIVLKEAFGKECTVDSQFHLFSGTKLYTAIAILQLVERKQIALTDPVIQHLPDNAIPTDHKALDGITIEHCLGHVTTLQDTPMKAWLAAHAARTSNSGSDATTSPPTVWECLKRFDFQRKKNATPGQGPAQYGNINYVLLGAVIEHVSKVTYTDYIQRNILQPLGSKACFESHQATNLMSGTIPYWYSLVTYFLLERDVYQMIYANSHRLKQGTRGAGLYTLADFDLDCVSVGGLIGTAEDFAPMVLDLWNSHDNQSFKNNDSLSSKIILSPASWKAMVTMNFGGAIGVHSKEGVGYGFKLGKDFVNHEGGGPGFTTETRCYMKDGIGMVILTNKASMMFQECTVCHEICELVRNHFVLT